VRWLATAFWAVLDQGLFASSNFAINVCLARWLAPHDYGAFTIAYSVFLLLGTAHSALLTDPMIVFGPVKYHNRLGTYVAELRRGHWLFSACTSAGLASLGGLLITAGVGDVGRSLVALALANPFMLLLWLTRRTCYVGTNPRLAASGGLVYMAILLAGCYGAYRTRSLSGPAAFLLMAVASIVAAQWIKYGLSLRADGTGKSLRQEIRRDHWTYGRWAVGTGVLSALILHLYYVVLPLRHGLEATAALKALTNLAMPGLQSFGILGILAVPRLVRARETPAFAAAIRRLLVIYVNAGAGYWAVLGVVHAALVRGVYGGAYTSDSWLLWVIGAVVFLVAIIAVLESALRALERSDALFRAYAGAVATTCLVGIPLMLATGLTGAAIGLIVAHLCMVFMMARSVRTACSQTRS
jgi:O-antigen/teichoic acid export membrane protein